MLADTSIHPGVERSADHRIPPSLLIDQALDGNVLRHDWFIHRHWANGLPFDTCSPSSYFPLALLAAEVRQMEVSPNPGRLPRAGGSDVGNDVRRNGDWTLQGTAEGVVTVRVIRGAGQC
ncbi:hypothetical protein ACOMHN_012827 [Nucella lapillus]